MECMLAQQLVWNLRFVIVTHLFHGFQCAEVTCLFRALGKCEVHPNFVCSCALWCSNTGKRLGCLPAPDLLKWQDGTRCWTGHNECVRLFLVISNNFHLFCAGCMIRAVVSCPDDVSQLVEIDNELLTTACQCETVSQVLSFEFSPFQEYCTLLQDEECALALVSCIFRNVHCCACSLPTRPIQDTLKKHANVSLTLWWVSSASEGWKMLLTSEQENFWRSSGFLSLMMVIAIDCATSTLTGTPAARKPASLVLITSTMSGHAVRIPTRPEPASACRFATLAKVWSDQPFFDFASQR